MKNGDKPVNPIFNSYGFTTTPNNLSDFGATGLTKREYFAGLAMQGILAANPECLHGNIGIAVADEVASFAVDYADELLTQLEK